MARMDRVFWMSLASLLLSTGVYFLLRETRGDLTRVLLTALALGAPLVVFLWQTPATRLWGPLPEPLTLILAAGAGLAIWPGAWWLMEFVNEQVAEGLGPYVPVFVRLESWPLEVLYKGALLPLLVSLIVFGAAREALHEMPGGARAVVLAGLAAMLHIVIAPQGLVGALGYGLVGGVAAYISVRTGTLWGGLVPLFMFSYANLAFLDDLRDWILSGSRDYFETEWLVLVLVGAFVTLACTQIIRFRTEPTSGTARPSGMGWMAVGLLFLVLLFYALSEIDQRNETRQRLDAAASVVGQVGVIFSRDTLA